MKICSVLVVQVVVRRRGTSWEKISKGFARRYTIVKGAMNAGP